MNQSSLFSTVKMKYEAIAFKLRTRNKVIVIGVILLDFIGNAIFMLFRLVFLRKMGKEVEGSVNPSAILLIRADRIGDMILTTPAFKLLKERFPTALITCLASSQSSEIIDGNPYIDEIIIYDPPWFYRNKIQNAVSEYKKIWRIIRKHRFDLAIDFRGNFINFFFLMLITGIPTRVSFNEPLGGFMLTNGISYLPHQHETKYFIDLVKTLGGRTVPEPLPLITISKNEEEFAAGFFERNNIKTDDTVIVLHPGVGEGRSFKRWPEDRYVTLGSCLVKKYNAKILITGSTDELELAKKIKMLIGDNAIMAAGKIERLKALAAVIKRCTVCVGSSTGIIHLASAVDIPTVVLCGPEDPIRWHPLGNKYKLIKKDVPCRPCREKTCPHNGKCLRLITPDEVLSVVETYLK